MEDYRDEYWCTVPIDELCSEIMTRVRGYREIIDQSGMLDLWRLAHCAFYNLDESAMVHEGSRLLFGGEMGETIIARLGHLRPIIKYILITTTSTRVQYQPRAINTDYESKLQTYAAKSLLDYYAREKGINAEYISVALRSLVYGTGWLWSPWDPSLGKETEEDVDEKGNPTGHMRHEGDIYVEAKSPVDVIRSCTRKPGKDEWVIVRETANKWDIAAKYADESRPELREAILRSDRLGDEDVPRLFTSGLFSSHAERSNMSDDDIDVFHFYRKRSPAITDGRYAVVLGDDLWLEDGPLPYEDLPVYEMYPDEFLDVPFGYTSCFDLITNDLLYNGLASGAMSNLDASMSPNILLPEGCEMALDQVGGGYNIIKYPANAGKPEAMMLPPLQPATLDVLKFLQTNAELRSGVNATARGEQTDNVKSGTHAALMSAQALHFNSGFDQSYVQLIERHGTGMIRIFKEHAHTERMIHVVGETGAPSALSFSRDSVKNIDRVVVDVGNPMSRTIAGREAMASVLLEKGLIRDPIYYFEVLNTGQLDSLYRPQQLQIDTITKENEMLRSMTTTVDEQLRPMPDGSEVPVRHVPEVPVLVTDDHVLHIQRHVDELGSVDSRTNPQLLEPFLTHVRDHMWQMNNGDQEIQQVLHPKPMPPGGGPGGPIPNPGNAGMPDLTRPPGTPMGQDIPLPKLPTGPKLPPM